MKNKEEEERLEETVGRPMRTTGMWPGQTKFFFRTAEYKYLNKEERKEERETRKSAKPSKPALHIS